MAHTTTGSEDCEDIPTGLLDEDDDVSTDTIPSEWHKPGERKRVLVWPNIVSIGLFQIISLFGIHAAITSAHWATCLWTIIMLICGNLGITAGSHRLWSHRSFKAKWPLTLILTIFGWMAHQKSIIVWARDHRMHHKFQDTDADPYNPQRGFFFAHCGWVMVKKHPDVTTKGSRLDVSDLYADPIVRFQHNYYYHLMPLFTFILPTVAPMYFWNETYYNAFTINVLRYTLSLHGTWFVNSIAHKYGMRPFDKYISSVNSIFVAIWTIGEGWHNYHHAFPWDYRTSEVDKLNLAKYFIEFFEKVGWAYDLKSASENMIKNRVQRTGDGSHRLCRWEEPSKTFKNK